MTAKKTRSGAEAAEVDPRFLPVVDAFAAYQDVSRGKMMSSYGLKVNGKIFAMFGRGRFVAKLPKQRVDEMVSAGKGTRFDPGHGRLMKEWVAIEDQAAEWVELSKEAYDFVKGGKS
jgi:TfoX/Sxy family transcriptional regulator of competence genes